MQTLAAPILKQSVTPLQVNFNASHLNSEESSPGLTFGLSKFMEPLKSGVPLVTLDPSADEVTTPVMRKKTIATMTLAINRELQTDNF